MVLKLGRFGQIRNTWKVLKCGVGEGWKRSFGPIVREIKKRQGEKYRTYSKKNEGSMDRSHLV